MNKIKAAFIGIAIIVALSSAFAFRPCGCEVQQQYYQTSGGYATTGVWGVNYTCVGSGQYCTYIPDPNNPGSYVGCRIGQYTPFQ